MEERMDTMEGITDSSLMSLKKLANFYTTVGKNQGFHMGCVVVSQVIKDGLSTGLGISVVN